MVNSVMADKLSKEELWAYSRQIVLSEIGYEGQVKLKQGRVLIAGVGGLGTPVSLQLAAMGVGYIKIVDRDIISESDLHRQYLYDIDSIGLSKVEIAASRLSALNQRITIEPIPISIKQWNVEELVKDVDVVVDGLDSIETRYLLNRACVKHRIPYIYGGSIQSQGNVSTIVPKKTACLECFNPLLKDEDLPKCGIVGVYPPILSIISPSGVTNISAGGYWMPNSCVSFLFTSRSTATSTKSSCKILLIRGSGYTSVCIFSQIESSCSVFAYLALRCLLCSISAFGGRR